MFNMAQGFAIESVRAEASGLAKVTDDVSFTCQGDKAGAQAGGWGFQWTQQVAWVRVDEHSAICTCTLELMFYYNY